MNHAKGPWTSEETKLLKKLDMPAKVQEFLDSLKYDATKETRSPRRVLADKKAHCFSGAIFAAAALRFHGHPPLLMDLRAVRDDDHVLAVYRVDGHWGAIAKSNFTVLRYREPVYKSLRELAMSYFDVYFNVNGEKTLREYSVPMDLARFDEDDWMTTEQDLLYLGKALDGVRHFRVINKMMEKSLAPVHTHLLQAGLIGADPKGLFKPKF
ncbi:hypothetical protein JXA05_01270 [Candidatus Peregrinibacteria bacterium]|nr:hypothetical protein [Candidatus Peregrinibacteria bacterium]